MLFFRSCTMLMSFFSLYIWMMLYSCLDISVACQVVHKMLMFVSL